MGYAIAGIYVVMAALFTPMLFQLFSLTNRVTRIEDKLDNLTTEIRKGIEEKVEKKELEEIKRRVEVLEKKLAGTTVT